ncbi:MAG TPA: cupin domain-containing protein [Candidatus Acidoferrales bacterium]|nr:cupin domain-containing protein [Candidatus Acidoferrales bacterium]
MARYERKNFSDPTEVRKFEHGSVELLDIGDGTVGRFVLQPGWKWSNDIKPVVKTEWCEAPHFQYQISGRYHVKMKDGSEFDLGPGDVSLVPPGHDAWVIGNEPAIGIEWTGARIATTPRKP